MEKQKLLPSVLNTNEETVITSPQRIDTTAITGLRALASMNILVGHLIVTCHVTWQDDDFVDLLGGVSVSLFFLLSGFIVAIAYGRKDISTPDKKQKFKSDFYKKRFARLLPMYYFTILLNMYFVTYFIDEGGWFNFVLQWILMTPWFGGGPINGPLWQLASTVWVFLFFPYVLPFIKKITERFRWYCYFFILQAFLFYLLLFTVGYQMARGIPFRTLPVFIMGYLLGSHRMDYPTDGDSQNNNNICCSCCTCSKCCSSCCSYYTRLFNCFSPSKNNTKYYTDFIFSFVTIFMIIGCISSKYVTGLARMTLEPMLIFIQGLMLYSLTIENAKDSFFYKFCSTKPLMLLEKWDCLFMLYKIQLFDI